jgi:hypothetical protein
MDIVKLMRAAVGLGVMTSNLDENFESASVRAIELPVKLLNSTNIKVQLRLHSHELEQAFRGAVRRLSP